MTDVKAELLPDSLAGHWETAEGKMLAVEYAEKTRADLCHSELSDLNLANAIFMVGREDLSLIHYQQAAKERIRWLSVQLALATRPQPSPNGLVERLIKSVCSFRNADIEMRRAETDGEQPRLQKAGDRYQRAKWRMLDALKAVQP